MTEAIGTFALVFAGYGAIMVDGEPTGVAEAEPLRLGRAGHEAFSESNHR